MLISYLIQIILEPLGIAHIPEEMYPMIDGDSTKTVTREDLERLLIEAQTVVDSYRDGSFATTSEADDEQKAISQRDLIQRALTRFDLKCAVEAAQEKADSYRDGSVDSIIENEDLTDKTQRDTEERLAATKQALADFDGSLNS